MRKFVITVNGKSYEVEVEEMGRENITHSPAVNAAPTTPAPQPAGAEKKAEPAAPKVAAGPVPEGADTVKAPMPGTILDVKVNQGDSVSKGDVLVILEAMKMENEVVSPKDGKIVSVQVAKGSSVNAGDVLVAIE